MNKQELEILIDKSVLGTLTKNEKVKLDTYIMQHPNTKLEISMRTDLIKGLEYNNDQELRSILDKIHNEEIFSANNKIKKIGIVLIGSLIIIGSFLLYNTIWKSEKAQPADNATLYADYFNPFEPSVESRSNDNISDKSFQIFIDSYRTKDYQKSLATIQPFLSEADNNTLLLAGISAMEVGKNQDAIKYLNRIIESNDFYFTDHAKWYKALVLLKMNNLRDAKLLLKDQAEDPKADHHNEAILLLQEL